MSVYQYPQTQVPQAQYPAQQPVPQFSQQPVPGQQMVQDPPYGQQTQFPSGYLPQYLPTEQQPYAQPNVQESYRATSALPPTMPGPILTGGYSQTMSRTSAPAPAQPNVSSVSWDHVNQLNQELAQIKAELARKQEEENQTRLAGMRPTDRHTEEIATLKRLVQESARSANEWYIEAEKNNIIRQYNEDIDASALDTSSIQALRASVPAAIASWQRIEARVREKRDRELGFNLQAKFEELPPRPGQYVATQMPVSNRASAMPMSPYGQQPAQLPPHPQLQAGYQQQQPQYSPYQQPYAQQQPYSQGRVVQPVSYPAQQIVQAQQQQYVPGQGYMSEQLGYEAPTMYHQAQQGTQQAPDIAAATAAIRQARSNASTRSTRGRTGQADYSNLPDPGLFQSQMTHPQMVQAGV